MNPRVEYEMSEEDLKAILDACKPVPYMLVGGHAPSSQQENANAAWARLGEKMGFNSMRVRPGSNQRKFTAVPSETAAQRDERVVRETEEKRQADVARLKAEIADKQSQLAEIEG